MVLSAILKLDAGAFTTPLGKAVEGIKAAIRISAELSDRLKEAFDLGGALSDLQAQTGELPGTLLLLRQAFQDTGVGADALGQTLAIMRRSMGGISETGEPTAKIFEQLGLKLSELQRMDATAQLKTIGAAVSSLKTPAEQTAAAMAIFGRSGARMLTLLKDPQAMSAAAQTLGGLPGIMNRNAAAFDAVSDRMEHVKGKSLGLWAGIAEGILPLADQMTAAFDAIDLTGIGQRIGELVGTTVTLFKQAPLGQTIKDLLTVGFTGGLNVAITSLVKLGNTLWKVLTTPLAYFNAAFAYAIQANIWALSKIPKLNKLLGLEGFKADSFKELLATAKDDLGKMVNPDFGFVKLFSSPDAEKRLTESWDASRLAYRDEIAAVQKKAQQAGGPMSGSLQLEATKPAKSDTQTIDTDALTRIGGYLGIGSQSRQLALGERTARGVERMVSLLETQRPRQAAWGV